MKHPEVLQVLLHVTFALPINIMRNSNYRLRRSLRNTTGEKVLYISTRKFCDSLEQLHKPGAAVESCENDLNFLLDLAPYSRSIDTKSNKAYLLFIFMLYPSFGQ